MSDAETIYRVKLQEQIAENSPEGRPAHPTFGLRSFGVIILAAAIVLMLLGVVLAFLVEPIAAAVFVTMGLVVLFVNPEVWTALLRGKERAEAEQDLVYEKVEA